MADPVRPIQMVGAPGTLPPELQARAAQVALQQQIANAMLAQSMEVGPATIHGPAGNPFAREVMNLGPLGKMFQSYYGYGKGQEAADTMQQIAALGEQQRQQGLFKAFSPVDVPGQAGTAPPDEMGGGPPSPDVPPTQRAPSPLEIAISLIGSSHPANQAMGQDWLAHQFTASDKNMLTPEVLSSLMSPRGPNFRPEDVTRAIGTSPLTGAPTLDASKLTTAGQRPTMTVTSPEQSITATNTGQVGAGAPGGAAPGAPASTVVKPGRTPEDISAGKDVVERFTDPKSGLLPTSFDQARDFQLMAPTIGNMLRLTENATMGSQSAKWIQEARMYATQLGITNQETLDKVVNLQTLMKYAMIPAIRQTKDISSRPSTIEFMKSLETMAADPSVQPDTARTVFRNFFVNGLNDVAVYNKNMKLALDQPEVATRVNAYNIPELRNNQANPGPQGVSGGETFERAPTINADEKLFAQLGAQTGQDLHFTKSPEGIWHDEDAVKGAPLPGSPAAKAAAEKAPVRTRTIDGKPYYFSNDKWYPGTPP